LLLRENMNAMWPVCFCLWMLILDLFCGEI
jgi:hypothetical protein